MPEPALPCAAMSRANARDHLCPFVRPVTGGDCGCAHFRASCGTSTHGSCRKNSRTANCGLGRVRGRDGEIIDEALMLWFPAPHSETGEDVAELQVHGGRAIIGAVFAVLSCVPGLRPAEAGEFTRRAFENGKLDLTAVEGLADLVMAETEGQRRLAFRQMTGALGGRAENWRAQLIQALALVEARIDFSDEADVPQDLVTPALRIARALEAEIAFCAGRPWSRREATRGPDCSDCRSTECRKIDVAQSNCETRSSDRFALCRHYSRCHRGPPRSGGLPVTLLDTAGIRETEDPVELEGVRRARDRANAADLVLWVVDASEKVTSPLARSNARQ